MKSINLKKLSIKEIWQLYKNLSGGLSNEEYLIDEISAMLGKISVDAYTDSLGILYDRYEHKKYTSIKNLLNFISGLRKTDFFVFSQFVEGIRGNAKR